MRISDWSSDVCSSDLYQPHFLSLAVRMHGIGEGGGLHPRALKCVWPFGGIAWKADPCPIMLGPFGWLAVGHGFQSRACQRFTPSLSQTEDRKSTRLNSSH